MFLCIWKYYNMCRFNFLKSSHWKWRSFIGLLFVRQDNTLLVALKTDEKGDPDDRELEASAFLIYQLAKQMIIQIEGGKEVFCTFKTCWCFPGSDFCWYRSYFWKSRSAISGSLLNSSWSNLPFALTNLSLQFQIGSHILPRSRS